MATGFNTQVGNGEYRLQFETDNKEHYLLMQESARRCVDGKPKTNADRIRSMSDEELAWELMLWRCEAVARHHGISSEYPDTQKTILDWLRQPEEGETLCGSGEMITDVNEKKLAELIEEAIDYERLCREIKHFTGSEEYNPFAAVSHTIMT